MENTPLQMVWNVADGEMSTLADASFSRPWLRYCRSAHWPAWRGPGRAQRVPRKTLFALVRLASRILAVMKFGLELVKIPVRVEGFGLVNGSQEDASLVASHKSIAIKKR